MPPESPDVGDGRTDRYAPPPAPDGGPTPDSSIAAVSNFYGALGRGDGAQAANYVVPEKRSSGALSGGQMSRFYGGLREPLRVTEIYPLDENTAFVRYRFVSPGGRVCRGAANVVTTHREGETLVSNIRVYTGC